MLDLLDYCQRSITRLLVQSEGGGKGKIVESEGSSSEDEESGEDGETVPSKKKILTVFYGEGREKGGEMEKRG